ncbi:MULTISPECIES: RNA polymerase-associated protein RapA [unclassified Oceanobacter]|uniref:RNA polymerase-associated protein RapA n=1 Tax=unclassified Oceanobacter TaxID=2620260 RepID=UPI002736D001|nr:MULTISPECIES: RNA polymerase-associated protein RapA [unclassified Oceanobacter]MDP2546719.1 RNA polymerase-associated protein RapA [Oceanobacter sp. 4_MG-2023]MDP2608541.1 RNA polymerase-associated protein RapA [Oceanobacter sp. 1_MG-2023]MDP2611697.1 RNA polymerase-associated protein RapA [Oceanobacter sp. 2_MG-2023]
MYAVGQRWISEAETDLGLGLVQSVDFRSVTLYFPSIDDVRTYASHNAPLTRVIFKVGDVVPLQDGSVIEVDDVEVMDDIAFYFTKGRSVSEIQLSGAIQLNQPADRLFSGQIDNNSLYELRQLCFQQITKLRQRPFYGLLGARTSLLPHQLYIAQQVTQDSIPRVLLADEVGLGKTIEAGLILHRLLLQQRIQRVLILVPDHLLHQWLVEMIRRFNLRFSILQQDDIDEAIETGNTDLFGNSQLHLCPMSMADEPDVAVAMMNTDWDMIVVDEAHHLTWTPEHQDPAYQLVEDLAEASAGILLLTATPEQLGIEGHFARLRLLDPDRYPSLDQFLAEQQAYQPIAELAGALAENEPLSAEQQGQLQQLLPDLATALEEDKGNNRLLDALIDRRGPGRAMFRNTRHGVSGFPARVPHLNQLAIPDYEAAPDDINAVLFPERGQAFWWLDDPRVSHLLELLKQTGKAKMVLICHHASTVLDLEAYLWEKHGMQVAVFHEHMDLVERDRAAAYFADPEQGARLLLCSEIGSEGRNFQFAHQLVLFDLPFNCDLIEQRIGRLDRIGQANEIQIHSLAFEQHATGRWQQLLHQGLDVFTQPNPAAQTLLERHREAVHNAVLTGDGMEALVATLSSERLELQQQLEQGRDRLLELHSCHPKRSRSLARDMTITHIEDEAELNDFIELFADAFGVEVADLDNDCIALAPGDHMLVPDLPYLPEDGFMATTRREVALTRDDVQFLSWEHPFIDQALELVTSGPIGNASVGYVEQHDYKTGDCFIQLQFVASCPAPKHLQIERYLPADAMHLTFTPTGELKVNEPDLAGFVLPLKRGTAKGLAEQKMNEVKPLIYKLEKLGGGQLNKMIQRATNKANEAFDDRLQRLQALAQHNPNIPEQLISDVQQERQAVLAAIETAQLQMDSVRLVFCG